MTHLADLDQLGYLPLQCHDKDYGIEMREVARACRVVSLEDHEGGTEIDGIRMTNAGPKKHGTPSLGDILGAVLWSPQDTKRSIPGWYFAAPSAPGRKIVDGGTELSGFLPIRNRQWEEDERFVPMDATAPPLTPEWPGHWPGTTMGATEEYSQEPVWVPGFAGLVAAWFGADKFSSHVFDIDTADDLDEIRYADLHTALRVVRHGGMQPPPPSQIPEPISTGGVEHGTGTVERPMPSTVEGNNHGGMQGGDTVGGTVVRGKKDASAECYLAYQLGAPSWMALAENKIPGSHLDKGQIIGWASHLRGGFAHAGFLSDKHAVGTGPDGDQFGPGHLWTGALWAMDPERDAPMEFQRVAYSNPSSGPFAVQTHLRHDKGTDLWRWESSSLLYTPPPPTPVPRPDPDTPPLPPIWPPGEYPIPGTPGTPRPPTGTPPLPPGGTPGDRVRHPGGIIPESFPPTGSLPPIIPLPPDGSIPESFPPTDTGLAEAIDLALNGPGKPKDYVGTPANFLSSGTGTTAVSLTSDSPSATYPETWKDSPDSVRAWLDAPVSSNFLGWARETAGLWHYTENNPRSFAGDRQGAYGGTTFGPAEVKHAELKAIIEGWPLAASISQATFNLLSSSDHSINTLLSWGVPHPATGLTASGWDFGMTGSLRLRSLDSSATATNFLTCDDTGPTATFVADLVAQKGTFSDDVDITGNVEIKNGGHLTFTGGSGIIKAPQGLEFTQAADGTHLTASTAGIYADTDKRLYFQDVDDANHILAYSTECLGSTTLANDAGDLLVGAGGSSWNKLNKGTDNYVLGMSGTSLTWQLLNLTDMVTSELYAVNGGTGIATPAAGAVLYGNTSSSMTALAIGGSSGQLLASNGITPRWGSLAGDISGAYDAVTVGKIQNITIDGTGPSVGQILLANSGGTQWDVSNPTFLDSIFRIKDNTTPTKIAAFDASSISASTTRTYVLPDADGTLALVGGAATAHALLDGSVHSDTVADTVTRGSLIYGNATPKFDELVLGADGAILQSDGTDIAWTIPTHYYMVDKSHYLQYHAGVGALYLTGAPLVLSTGANPHHLYFGSYGSESLSYNTAGYFVASQEIHSPYGFRITGNGYGLEFVDGTHYLKYASGDTPKFTLTDGISTPTLTLSTTPLAETSGGTGQATYTQGDLLYSDGANSLAKLALGDTGDGVVSDGTDVKWGLQNVGSRVDDKTDWTITYDEGTRVFNVTAAAAKIYHLGIPTTATFAGVNTGAHADTTASYWLTIDSGGSLAVATSIDLLADVIPLASVYYNATTNKGIALDERHEAVISSVAHLNAHTRGATFLSGFADSGYTLDAAGTANLQIEISEGVLNDDGLLTTIAALGAGSYTIAHRSGADANGEWTWVTGESDPLLHAGAGNKIYYSLLAGGNWANTEAVNRRWVNYFLVALPAITAGLRHVFIMGQTLHGSYEEAVAESVQTINWGGFKFAQEILPLYQLVYRVRGTYGDPGDCRLDDVRDIRGQSVSIGATSASTPTPITSFSDANFAVYDDGDATKILALQCSGITTATTRTWTIPDADGTFLSTAVAAAAYQPLDADLTSLAALGTAADKMAYTTGANTWAETAITAAGRAILDDANAAAQQTTLGLVPGTDVQAYDATLLSIAALGTAADKIAYTTAADTWAEAAITAFGRSIIDDADAATVQATLGLVPGTNVQAYDAQLAAIAGSTPAANKIILWSAVDALGFLDFKDEDNMASNSATALCSQQSIKAYADSVAGGSCALLDGSTHTDTVAQAVTRGSIIYANATPKWDEYAIGTGVLHGDGTDVTGWSLVDLTADVTGDLPIAEGGTGASTQQAGFDALSPVTTRGDLIIRDASNNIRLAIGGANSCLITDGTDPSWGTLAIAGGGTGQTAKTAAMDALSPVTTRGDLIYRDASNNVRLAVGADNSILASNGTDPAYETLTSLLDSISSTQGAVLYRGAATWAALGAGTDGQVLTSTGAASNPAWEAASGSSSSSGPTLSRTAIAFSGLSGASATSSGAIPAGAHVVAITGRVTTALTGATSFDIGDDLESTVFHSGVAVALNTAIETEGATFNLSGMRPYRAAGDLVLTAQGGNFSAGALTLRIYYYQFLADTDWATADVTLSSLSGATATSSGAIPAGAHVVSVTGRVTVAVEGATSFDIGDGLDSTLFYDGVAIAANTAIEPGATYNFGGMRPFLAASDLVLTAQGGDFSAGTVVLRIHYYTFSPPEAV